MRKNSVWIWVCYWRTAGHFWLHPSSFCISRYSDTVNKTLICVTDFHHSTTFCLIHASLVWTQSGVSAVNKLFINNWIRQALMNKSSEGEKYEFLNHFYIKKTGVSPLILPTLVSAFYLEEVLHWNHSVLSSLNNYLQRTTCKWKRTRKHAERQRYDIVSMSREDMTSTHIHFLKTVKKKN